MATAASPLAHSQRHDDYILGGLLRLQVFQMSWLMRSIEEMAGHQQSSKNRILLKRQRDDADSEET